PILVNFEATCPRLNLLNEAGCSARAALAEKAEIHRKAISGLQHPLCMPRSWSAGRRVRSHSRSRSTAQQCCQAWSECCFDLLWTEVVNVRVDAAACANLSLAGDHFSSWSYNYGDVRLDIRISSFPYADNATIFESNIRFYNSPVIENQSVG